MRLPTEIIDLDLDFFKVVFDVESAFTDNNKYFVRACTIFYCFLFNMIITAWNKSILENIFI